MKDFDHNPPATLQAQVKPLQFTGSVPFSDVQSIEIAVKLYGGLVLEAQNPGLGLERCRTLGVIEHVNFGAQARLGVDHMLQGDQIRVHPHDPTVALGDHARQMGQPITGAPQRCVKAKLRLAIQFRRQILETQRQKLRLQQQLVPGVDRKLAFHRDDLQRFAKIRALVIRHRQAARVQAHAIGQHDPTFTRIQQGRAQCEFRSARQRQKDHGAVQSFIVHQRAWFQCQRMAEPTCLGHVQLRQGRGVRWGFHQFRRYRDAQRRCRPVP